MHRDDDRRAHVLQQRDHFGQRQRQASVHRGHDHVEPPDRRVLLRRRRVVEMAEVADAEALHLKDEDRVAVSLRRSAETAPDVCGHVTHQHLAEIETVLGRTVPVRVPAPQHMRDSRVRRSGPVRAVGVVHRHDVGDEFRWPDEAIVVGHHGQAAGRLDQKHRMVDVADADGLGRHDRPIIDCAAPRRLPRPGSPRSRACSPRTQCSATAAGPPPLPAPGPARLSSRRWRSATTACVASGASFQTYDRELGRSGGAAKDRGRQPRQRVREAAGNRRAAA